MNGIKIDSPEPGTVPGGSPVSTIYLRSSTTVPYYS
jgi:hypothetical protein